MLFTNIFTQLSVKFAITDPTSDPIKSKNLKPFPRSDKYSSDAWCVPATIFAIFYTPNTHALEKSELSAIVHIFILRIDVYCVYMYIYKHGWSANMGSMKKEATRKHEENHGHLMMTMKVILYLIHMFQTPPDETLIAVNIC